ncbi:MAG: flagellar biosynthetic protein FliQ [Planctomycetota bacterium]|nr:flagellar biosynthetic protein FliQ [Planctomycetota bacterium]
MVELVSNAVMQVIILSIPFLVAGLLISLLTGFLQAITQIQDATISFVPRLLFLLLLLILGLPWFMEMIAGYSSDLFRNITISTGWIGRG